MHRLDPKTDVDAHLSERAEGSSQVVDCTIFDVAQILWNGNSPWHSAQVGERLLLGGSVMHSKKADRRQWVDVEKVGVELFAKFSRVVLPLTYVSERLVGRSERSISLPVVWQQCATTFSTASVGMRHSVRSTAAARCLPVADLLMPTLDRWSFCYQLSLNPASVARCRSSSSACRY
jgi:hypothetical protein